MNSLRGLQRDFQDCLLAGDESIRDQVIGTERVSADVRLGIYVDAYRLRLLDVLATDYPGVEALLGSDESFAQMGSAYIAAHPSPYFNVRWYGDRMAEFLATAMPYRDCPVLAEMAAFEWAMALAFDAADALVVSIEQVASLSPEAWAGMVCRMHSSVQRLDFRWNIPAIWQAVDAKAEPETSRESDQAVPWLVWRRELKVCFRSLNADEAWAVDAMIAGANFGDICTGLCEWIEETRVALHAAAMLKCWLADGLIHEVRHDA